MLARLVSAALAVGALIAASGMTARAEESPVLPLHVFFANSRAAADHRISPDGSRLAWTAMRDGRWTLHYRRLDEATAHPVETPRELRPSRVGISFWWSADSRRLLFVMDGNGDDNTHLFSVDTLGAAPRARDLTPLAGVRVDFVSTLANDPQQVLVRHNGRAAHLFDLYRLNLETGELTLHAKNPGDIGASSWSIVADGTARMRIRSTVDGGFIAEVPAGPDRWRELFRGRYGDLFRVVGYPSNPNYGFALSNRGRDRMALVQFDLRNGAEDVIYEHPEADLAGGGMEGGRVAYVWAWPRFQEWRIFDAGLRAELGKFLPTERTSLRLLSRDRSGQLMTLAVDSDRGDEAIYLLDRRTRQAKLLSEAPMQPYQEQLARTEPISFAARDGLKIQGLLTTPNNTTGRRPMMLLVHGGPWVRDRWGYNATVQFLANRGYAVLQVNFRGSSDFGRNFMTAGTYEVGRKMQDDLIDGVRWAVAQGTADPARIGIMGESYGGYAALAGLAFAPDVFAAGVDYAGMSDMVSLIEKRPPYWAVEDGFRLRFYGDPSNPNERSMLAERSPINSVNAIKAPLLIVQSANDVRTPRDQSDRIVAALRERKHDIEYLLIPNEGHNLNQTNNRIAYMRAVEQFLNRHLGGRVGGS